jgi:hypothetical protein
MFEQRKMQIAVVVEVRVVLKERDACGIRPIKRSDRGPENAVLELILEREDEMNSGLLYNKLRV